MRPRQVDARESALTGSDRTPCSTECTSFGRRAPFLMARRQGMTNLQRPIGFPPPSRARPCLDPLGELERLIARHNNQHTVKDKSVSFKTQQLRAYFLRRFFRDLKLRAGFKLLPQPRNLGDKHIRAMVQVWQGDGLSPSSFQNYLSCLRGLAIWVNKPGLVREPAYYGLEPKDYRRSGIAQTDKSWTAKGVDIDALIYRVCEHDIFVGTALRMIRAFGLRRREALMLKPRDCVIPSADAPLPLAQVRGEVQVETPDVQTVERCLWIRQGAKGGRQRFIPINTALREAAVEHALSVANWDDHAHLGNPRLSLKQNLNRFATVMRRFGITNRALGVTAHGLRHEVMIEEHQRLTGQPPPIRGGGQGLSLEEERAARLAISLLAGHNRRRASAAYLGQSAAMRGKGRKAPPPQ